MGNLDLNQLMKMASKMSKQDLEKAINQANAIMNSKDKDKIIEELKKKMNQFTGGMHMAEDLSSIFNNVKNMVIRQQLQIQQYQENFKIIIIIHKKIFKKDSRTTDNML